MRKNPKLQLKRTQGFSLVEMLIVIGLIALVGSLVIGRVGNLFGGAQEDIAQNFVKNSLKAPLLKYRIDLGSYPTTEVGLNGLVKAPAGKENKWKGAYTEELPDDPWGNPYQYRYPGTKNTDSYDLWSKGPDGNSDTADDIGNW